jgi:hypothetical protein
LNNIKPISYKFNSPNETITANNDLTVMNVLIGENMTDKEAYEKIQEIFDKISEVNAGLLKLEGTVSTLGTKIDSVSANLAEIKTNYATKDSVESSVKSVKIWVFIGVISALLSSLGIFWGFAKPIIENVIIHEISTQSSSVKP